MGVTCRHVLFSSDNDSNYICRNDSAPARGIQLLGTREFEKLIKSIKDQIEAQGLWVECHKRQINKLQERVAGGVADDVRVATNLELEKEQGLLNNTNKMTGELERFHKQVKNGWGESQCVIGTILCSPPMSFDVRPKGFTEDYAVFELKSSKFRRAFRGNMIDLGAF